MRCSPGSMIGQQARPTPYGCLRTAAPAAYRDWRDAFARLPLAITIATSSNRMRAESKYGVFGRADGGHAQIRPSDRQPSFEL